MVQRVSSDNYEIVQDRSTLNRLLNELRHASVIALDLETTGFEADGYGGPADKIVGWAFSTSAKSGWYIPVGHTQGQQIPSQEVTDALKPILENPNKAILIHNAKFDTHFIREVGIDIPYHQVEDTMLEALIAGYKDKLQRVGLKYISMKVWSHKQVAFDDLFPPRTKKKNIATVDIDRAGFYACEDADYCFRIHQRYYAYIQGHKKLAGIYALEKELWPLTQRIEDTGIYIDTHFAETAIDFLRSEAARVYNVIVQQITAVSVKDQLNGSTEPVWDQTKYPKPAVKKGDKRPNYWIKGFNPGSSDQLADVLFNVLKLRSVKSTKGGKPSTGKLVLERLGKQLPVCKNIETYKQMVDAISKLQKEILDSIKYDGRAHTNYNQGGTRSGRYSSSSPNFQNLSREKKWTIHLFDGTTYEVKLSLRDAIRATPGYRLFEFDFSAIEFVIYAKFAGDSAVVFAYENGLDVHKQTARDMFGIAEAAVTKDQRDLAKQINYLMIYEGGGEALSMRTELSKIDAEIMISRFFEVRPKFKRYADLVHKDVQGTHTVWTVFGRPIYIAELDSEDKRDQSKGERAAVNGIIQGTAADIQKKGLLRCYKEVSKQYSPDQARMILQTHDSQTWELRNDQDVNAFVKLVISKMPTAHPLLPSVKVDAKSGIAWGSTREFGEDEDFGAFYQELEHEQKGKIDVMAKGTDPAPPLADVVEAPVKKKRSGVSLNLWIKQHPSKPETAAFVNTILGKNPGDNIVTVHTPDGASYQLKDWPTSLGAKKLENAIVNIWPDCEVDTDKKSALLAASAALT